MQVQVDGVRFAELDGRQLFAQLVAVEQVHFAADLEPRPVGVRETPTRTGMTVGGLTRYMAFQMPKQGPGSAGLRASVGAAMVTGAPEPRVFHTRPVRRK